ncbi:hypothetical protein N7488_002195 [Penicillium malachiteum]|nr:hypothetical protein N7488_002195 [Penicillium malachiteum]
MDLAYSVDVSVFGLFLTPPGPPPYRNVIQQDLSDALDASPLHPSPGLGAARRAGITNPSGLGES